MRTYLEADNAIMAAGYDYGRIIRNTKYNLETKGAFLIRKSWESGWGEEGYGWLPNDYVRYQLVLDFWSILDMRWVDTGEFGIWIGSVSSFKFAFGELGFASVQV